MAAWRLHTLPLALRRRFPNGVLATSVASGLAVALLGLSPVFLGLAILVSVYTVAAYRDRPGSLVALAVVEAAVAVSSSRRAGSGRSRGSATHMVAHSMSVIAVQSGVGAHVAEAQPEEARKALAAIEATSRTTLNELRRLLGVLREDSEPQGSLAPVPGLDGLDRLIAQMGEAGRGRTPPRRRRMTGRLAQPRR